MRWFLLLVIGACARPTPPAELPAPGAFPHQWFSEVLGRFVDARGYIDYAGLTAERPLLDRYTGLIASVSPESHPALFPSREDQLAYYLNAYNALAITGVIDRPGLESVHDNSAGFFYLTRYPIGGEKMSLYTLENKVIREGFLEPRIHFALNCMSVGCPRLLPRAFVPDTLEADLQAVTVEFVTTERHVRVEADAVYVSQIFEWYAEDFVAAGGVLAFINANGGSVPTDRDLRYIPYDWGLIAQ